jgi:hypothetical protein
VEFIDLAGNVGSTGIFIDWIVKDCDTPDITVGSYTIKACNVGASVAGTGVASYGSYFQRGNNFGFATTGTIPTSSTLVDASSY